MTDMDTTKINREGCAWIAKLHDAEPSAQELEEFRTWMAQSPAHKEEIRKLAKLWGELNILTELSVAVEAPINQRERSTFFPHPRFIAGSLAAAALVLLVIFALPFYSVQDTLHDSESVFTTAVGEQQLVTLDDGSTILLNTNSQVKVDYSQSTRKIYLLEGEAHFDVLSDPERSFLVYSGVGVIRTLGTAFSVLLKGNALEVTVTEGSIELNLVEKTVLDDKPGENKTPAPEKLERLAILNAGQNAIFDAEAKAIESIETVDELEIAAKLSWHDGLLRFSGDPLHEVIAEVTRYTQLSVVILDPEIRDLRIGGLFKISETHKLFEALETSFDIQVDRKSDNLIYLLANSSSPPSPTTP